MGLVYGLHFAQVHLVLRVDQVNVLHQQKLQAEYGLNLLLRRKYLVLICLDDFRKLVCHILCQVAQIILLDQHNDGLCTTAVLGNQLRMFMISGKLAKLANWQLTDGRGWG